MSLFDRPPGRLLLHVGQVPFYWSILKSHWLPSPHSRHLDIRAVWSSSIVTLFLQLIGLLCELTAKAAKASAEERKRECASTIPRYCRSALASLQGEILEANPHLCCMLGYSRERAQKGLRLLK